MDPTENIVSPAGDVDETQNVQGRHLVDLATVMKGFQKGEPSRCWFTYGNHISVEVFPGMAPARTFVLAHTSGELWVGHIGYLDGSLTFMRKKTFKRYSHLRAFYPDLVTMEGYVYKF